MSDQQSATPTGSIRRGASAVRPAVLRSVDFDVFFHCDQRPTGTNVVRVEAVNMWEAEDKARSYAAFHGMTRFHVEAVVTSLPPRTPPSRMAALVKRALYLTRNALAVLGFLFAVLLGISYMQYQDRVAAGDTSCSLTHCA